MYNLTPIRSLPVATAPPSGSQYNDNVPGLRDDGSFDFTQFFTNFDLDSEISKYLDEWDPARFLAILRLAATPVPKPPKKKSSLPKANTMDSTDPAMVDYHTKVEARRQAKVQLDKDIETLDAIIAKMDEAEVPGVDQLKIDFAAAKTFIFDSVANSSSRVLDIHLEFDDGSAPGTPRTPAAPAMGTIPLPIVTPTGTPPLTPGHRWPAMLTGPAGLIYRVVATPREICFDSSNYFASANSSNSSMTSIIDAFKTDSPTGKTKMFPPSGRRPTNWFRTLSGLRTPGAV